MHLVRPACSVIVEPDDIYGDGVNIASRIEGIAEPGQVYISGAIYEQIKHKVVCGYESLGDRKVKNITDPVRVYKVLPDADAVGKTKGRRENILIFLLSLTLLVIATGVLWYLLTQAPGKVSEQAALPAASPAASTSPQPPPREGAADAAAFSLVGFVASLARSGAKSIDSSRPRTRDSRHSRRQLCDGKQ